MRREGRRSNREEKNERTYSSFRNSENQNTKIAENSRHNMERKEAKVKKKNNLNLKLNPNKILIIIVILIIAYLGYIVLNSKNNPKKVVRNFMSEVQDNMNLAKTKYSIGELEEKTEKELQSKLKYEILEVTEEKNESTGLETAKVKLKLKNIDSQRTRLKAEQVLRESGVTIVDEDYAKKYLEQIKKEVKDAEVIETETTIELSKQASESRWKITNYSGIK